jgi:hypothetical protein
MSILPTAEDLARIAKELEEPESPKPLSKWWAGTQDPDLPMNTCDLCKQQFQQPLYLVLGSSTYCAPCMGKGANFVFQVGRALLNGAARRAKKKSHK